MKEITLTFNGTTTKLISDDKGMFRLNTLHRASGFGKVAQPNNWKQLASTKVLVGELSNPGIPGLVSNRGGSHPGTWAIEELVYAYASWISPEFHAAVIEAFTHAVNGDGKKAVKKAQSVARVKSKEMIENLEVQNCTSKIQKKAVREFRR